MEKFRADEDTSIRRFDAVLDTGAGTLRNSRGGYLTRISIWIKLAY